MPFFRRSPALLLLGWILATPLLAAERKPSELQGQELAAELRQLRPLEGAGLLRLRDADGRWIARVPVKVGFTEGEATWQAHYHSFETNGLPAETLTVIHTAGQPNEYLLRRVGGSVQKLAGATAAVPFANSEFWLTDLGLEFLQWPEQRILKSEMRKGRSCRVLESVNPDPGPAGYSRVLAWVDIEHRGIVRAEAYGHDRKLLKEFSIGSFTKTRDAEGKAQWQLKSMEIRNEASDARTRLEFDYSAPQ